MNKNVFIKLCRITTTLAFTVTLRIECWLAVILFHSKHDVMIGTNNIAILKIVINAIWSYVSIYW